VLCAVALAKANGMIILCTDGLANVGLGAMDKLESVTDQEAVEAFYKRVAEQAKANGIVINTISIEGDECKLENLGILAVVTSGTVDIVNPLNLEKNFDSILAKPTIAKNVKLRFLISSKMYVRSSGATLGDGMELEEKEDRANHVEKDIGNVNADSDVSLEYGVKPDADFTKEKLDYLPFQVQIHYTRLDGSKCVRVITKRQKATTEKQEALQDVDLSVLSHNAVQQTAIMAQMGDYEGARLWQRSNEVLMHGLTPVLSASQQQTYSGYVQISSSLDDQLESMQQRDEGSSYTDTESRYRERQRLRSDSDSRTLYQAKSASRSTFSPSKRDGSSS